MADNIIVDGIIDVIKELKEKAKCPFCNENLGFERADNYYHRDSTRFTLLCRPCQLAFTLQKGKKDKWSLNEVIQRYIPQPPRPTVT